MSVVIGGDLIFHVIAIGQARSVQPRQIAGQWWNPLHEVAGAGLEQSGWRWRDGAVSEIYGAMRPAHRGMGRMAIHAGAG